MEDLEKKKLTTQQRKKIPSGKFAYIDSKGGEHLPIQDKAHVQNAMARFNQTHFESSAKKKTAARKILAAARRFGIEIDPNSAVARAAKGGVKSNKILVIIQDIRKSISEYQRLLNQASK